MYDNTVSARTYLSYIAEQAGGIAVIGRDGKLYIKTIGESSVTLPLKLFKTFKWGEKFKITRVRYDDGTQLFEKGDTTGNTVYISQDNMYIVDQDQINNIYNTLKGLEFYSFEGESIIDPAIDTGDIVVIDGKNVIYQGSMQFSGRWIANIESKIQCKAKEETTTRTPSQKIINRRVQSSINQIDGKITQLTEETTENTQKLTKVEQDVNGITSKVSSVEQSVENITNTQGEAEGKNIHIEDSSEEPLVSIKAKGETTQATRSGKNLAILGVTSGTIGEVPFIVDKGTININGTTISGDANYYFNSFRVSNSGVATFWIEITGYTDKLSNQAGILLQESSDNSTWSTTKEISCKSTATKQYQVTLDNSKYYRIRFYTKENTFTNATIKIQLEYGTNKTEFEEAGVSPSPDYKSPIENVEGKNKFDYESAINVENLTYDNTYAFFEIKNIKPNTAYTISNLKLTDLTNLGYSVYAGLTIGNTYSTGPGKAFHCCIYNNVYKNGIGVVTGYSDTKANGGKLYFCIATTNTNEDLAYERFIKICSMVFDKAQIEEGSVATPYVPYNSLEFKVEGKNKFNVQDTNNVTEGITVDNEGWITVTGDNTDGTATKYFNYYTNNLNLKTGTNFNVIAEVKNVSGTGNASFVSVNSSSQQFKTNFYRNFSVLANNTIYNSINETSDEFLGNTGLRTFISFSAGQSGSITFRLSLLEYTTITPENFDYEPYKSQVATFPLGNQKLMEGSYLDDEGIHHIRKKVVLDGTETGWYTLANQTGTNTSYFCIVKSDMKKASTLICDKFINRDVWNTDEEAIQSIIDNYIRLRINTSRASTVAELKTWLSEHPITVEYELSEEETVPYTAEQQDAWYKIEQLHTYKNVTNITLTAYAKVTYMRDNGLDVYETKQNAQKKYTETSTEIQQLDDSIKRTISQIGDRSQKTTTVTEDIDGIKNEVSKIQDLTQTTNGTKTIVLSNCVKGNLLKLQIKGNNTVFKYLYPSDYLYPTDDLFPMGDSRISVTDKDNNETVYKLGITDVLRQNGEVYDEFVLENGQAKVIRRINADGTIKASETIENLGTFNIPLNEGTNTIKIKNYSAEIGAKYVVKSDYTEAFATKLEMNSSIEQTAEKIESKVSKTYETLEDARTQYSNIKQTTNEISTQVVKKVGKNEIISSINQSAEQIQVEADKININGTVSANGNFKVDTNGNMECNNGKFNGGTICLKGGTRYNTKFKIIAENGDDNTSISPTNIFVDSDDGGLFINGLNKSYQQKAYLYTDEGDEPNLYLYAANKGTTRIKPSGIKTPTLTQTSKAESKKNFENLSIEEAKKILNNTEIYKYNLKTQEDNDKKYIGFVIGDDYNYAEEITSENNDGANIYSMTSVLYTVVQEQQKQINQLQEKIEKSEGGQDK